MNPNKGIQARQAQARIEAEIESGERHYYQSVMHDEISNDSDCFDDEERGA